MYCANQNSFLIQCQCSTLSVCRSQRWPCATSWIMPMKILRNAIQLHLRLYSKPPLIHFHTCAKNTTYTSPKRTTPLPETSRALDSLLRRSSVPRKRHIHCLHCSCSSPLVVAHLVPFAHSLALNLLSPSSSTAAWHVNPCSAIPTGRPSTVWNNTPWSSAKHQIIIRPLDLLFAVLLRAPYKNQNTAHWPHSLNVFFFVFFLLE